jgi:hypothetical protein
MSAQTPASRRFPRAAFAIVTVLLAARLFLPAAVLTFSPKAADRFSATGLAPWIRLALALPEMLGAVLYAIPRTFCLGALLLLLDLIGAIAAHLSLGIQPISLYLLLAAVLSLALVRPRLQPCKRR